MGKPTEYIRKLMAERLLRKVDLENLSGLSRASVERHVRGAKEPNVEQRAKYAQAFGMSLAEFEAGWQGYSPPLFDVVDHELQYGEPEPDFTKLRKLAATFHRPLQDVIDLASKLLTKELLRQDAKKKRRPAKPKKPG